MKMPAMTRDLRRLSLLALLPLLLAGCTLLPEREPQRVFALPSGHDIAAAGPSSTATLRLDALSADAPLGGDRLLVMPAGSEYAAWTGVRWADAAPRLLQARLLEAFRRSGRLGGVVDDASPVRSDATLTGHLTAFHLRLDGDTRRAMVRLDAELIDEASRQLLASRRFAATADAADATPEAAVAAFGEASDALVAALLPWVLEAMTPPARQPDAQRVSASSRDTTRSTASR